jgi:hypothetical protein
MAIHASAEPACSPSRFISGFDLRQDEIANGAIKANTTLMNRTAPFDLRLLHIGRKGGRNDLL